MLPRDCQIITNDTLLPSSHLHVARWSRDAGQIPIHFCHLHPGSAGGHHGFGRRRAAAASSHPGFSLHLPVCIRSCPRGLAGGAQPPPAAQGASNGGCNKANANLWVNHQTINDNNPSTQPTQTQASWVRKCRILLSFPFPSL